MKKLLLIAAIIALGLLAGCSSKETGPDKKDKNEVEKKADKKESNKKGKDKKKTDAVPVEVVKTQKGDISSFLLLSSNLDAENYVKIYPMTSGIITEIRKFEGDKVRKGTILAVLDDREAAINERKAAIDYEKLKAEFARQKEMFEKDLISKETFEKLEFNLKQTKLDWKHKKLMLSYTRITSPIDGVVTRRNIKAGNKINVSDHSYTVVSSREKVAIVNIPEQEKNSVYLNQKVVISDSAEEVKGVVKRISPAIDPQSGTFKVTVEVNDKDGKLVIGQFVNVKIIKKVHSDVVLLAKDAIVYEGGHVFAYVVGKDNYAVKTELKTGFEEKDRVEITKGLAEGTTVVTAGKSSLKRRLSLMS